jgi:hypothetical protein
MYFFQISAPLAVVQSRSKKGGQRDWRKGADERTLKVVGEGDADLVRGAKEILSERRNL